MKPINLFHQSCFAMNTRFDMVLWGQKEVVQKMVFQTVQQKLQALELILSRFDPNAETYQLNRQAGKGAVRVSEKLFRVIKECFGYYQMTQGYFDVLYSVPNKSAMRDIVELDEATTSVLIKQKEAFFDFGAVGKGIALTEVNKVFLLHRIENAFVSFGESSILCRGRHPFGEYWPFSFQSIYGIKSALKLNSDAVSVSGLQNGVKGHIVDPITGALITKAKAIAVVGVNPQDLEVLSTALIAAPNELHKGILSGFKVKQVLC